MNKAIQLLAFLILASTSSCTSSTEVEKFKELTISFGEDGVIEKHEMDQLINFVKETKGKTFESMKTGSSIDSEKLCSFVLKILRKKNIVISEESIYGMVKTEPTKPFLVNVYLENSMSMDGYLEGKTHFETAIFGLLSDLKADDMTAQMSLNYINSKIIEIDSEASDSSIANFIADLEPREFRKWGGNRGKSQLDETLKCALNKVSSSSVSLFISDCIFSPGKNEQASTYLETQKIKLKSHFQKKIKTQPDLCALVIRLESNFNGTYYNQVDSPAPLKCTRPYFIWILGTEQNLKALVDSKLLENIQGATDEFIMYASASETSQPDFAIRRKGKIGDFKLDNQNTKILNAIPSQTTKTRGKFGFQLNTNLEHPFLSNSVFENPKNYSLSNPNYSIRINKTDPYDRQAVGYSHSIFLETNQLTDESLRIEASYQPSVPKWVVDSSCEEDGELAADVRLRQKTFGFEYLFRGVFNGFYPSTKKAPIIHSFFIQISQ